MLCGKGSEEDGAFSVTPYDIVQKLTEHGHDRETILHVYSLPEIRILYEKCWRSELARRADFIEDVMAGIGGCFGGAKEVDKLVRSLRAGR